MLCVFGLGVTSVFPSEHGLIGQRPSEAEHPAGVGMDRVAEMLDRMALKRQVALCASSYVSRYRESRKWWVPLWLIQAGRGSFGGIPLVESRGTGLSAYDIPDRVGPDPRLWL